MTMTIGGTSGLVFPDSSTQNTGATGFGFKNRIINGAMMIDQRNAGASVSVQTSTTYTLDRWGVEASANSKFTVQQSTTAPTGFVNSLLVTSSAATTVGSTDYYSLRYRIEGNNVADLGFGTASASTTTLSFWVRSSLTGTFGGAYTNQAGNRSYPFTYTITSANTWEQKTVTIAGDTTGTWITNNGTGLAVYFSLGMGSTYSGTAGSWAGASYNSATGATSVVGTNGATFYITGVQLEKGSTATSFDYRPYGTELALCQRYYNKITCAGEGVLGWCDTTTATICMYYHPVDMRSSPTLQTSGTAGDYQIRKPGGSTVCNAVPSIISTSTEMTRLSATVGSGLTAGDGVLLNAAGSTMYLGFVAEL